MALSILAALFLGACDDALPPPASPALQLPSSAANATPAGAPSMDRAAWMEAQARGLLARDDLRGAERAAEEAGHLDLQLRGPKHPDTGRVAELVAAIKLRLYDNQGAEQALLWALSAREAESGPSTLRVAEVLDLLVSATEPYAPDRAAAFAQRALGIRRAMLGADHPDVARTLLALGTPLLKVCRAADAEAGFREALAIQERLNGPSSVMVIEPLEKLSEARFQLLDDSGSEQLLARAAAVADPFEATEAERLVRLLGALAGKELERKDFASATTHQERALLAAERRLGPGSSGVIAAADRLATIHRAQNNEALVTTLFQRLSLREWILPPGSVAPSPAPKPASRCTWPGRPSGTVTNAQAVVAGLAPGFRACYNRALQQDPALKAAFRMTAKIGAGGEVFHVRALTPASYPEALVTCPLQRLLAARFSPPEGGGATVVVPLTFVSQ